MKKILIILLTIFLTISLFSCCKNQSKTTQHSQSYSYSIQTNKNSLTKNIYYNEDKLLDFDYNFDKKSDKPFYFALKFLKVIIIFGI